MIRQPFNSDWTVAARKSPYDEFIARRAQPLPAPTPVTLPHDAVRDGRRDPDCENGSHTGYYPGGNFRYEKRFDVPASYADRLVVLEFEAVHRDAMVYLNGDLAAQRPAGFSGFVVAADPYLRCGERNTIVVECRSHQDARWYVGAGIYRDVHIAVAAPAHIPLDGVRVTTEQFEQDDATVLIATTVRNDSRQTQRLRLDTVVHDPGGEIVARDSTPVTLLPNSLASCRARLVISPASLWSPDSPALYTVDSELSRGPELCDRDRTAFGIRQLALDAKRGLRLNGTPYKLRGACIHNDNGPLGAAAISAADARRVALLKAAGFNAIRAGHSPLSRATLDAADREGVLVIDELTDVWTEAKNGSDYSLAFPQWWERDLAAMVAKDFNHPSVLMYSIGNETFETGTPIGSSWSRALATRCRELDPTRPVANTISPAVAVFERLAGMLAPDGPGDAAKHPAEDLSLSGMVNSRLASSAIEESAACADVLALNYGEARYAADGRRYPNRVILGAESYPPQIAELWPAVLAHDHVIGDCTWTGWDYLGEAGLGRIDYTDEPGYHYNGFNAAYPALVSETGDLDIIGQRRTISHYREIVFGLSAGPFIAVHRPEYHGRAQYRTRWSWSDTLNSWSWPVPTGAPVAIDVYANADEILLSLDGRPLGRAAVGTEQPFIASFETRYVPGELTAVAFRDGAECRRQTLRSATAELVLDARPERARIRADSGDLAFVEISLRDAAGTLNNAAQRVIEAALRGPATLAALASGRPLSAQPFTATHCATHDGRALAIVRPTAPGVITLTLRSDDGLQAEAQLTAVAPGPVGLD